MPAEPDKPLDAEDDDENPAIPAGYTYLGQFIDHDLTFDPARSLKNQNDPDALVDFRTPRFDLDSLYGRGPDDQPYLYDDRRTRELRARPRRDRQPQRPEPATCRATCRASRQRSAR